YAAQLDDLAPHARRAARLASVAGRRFPRDALPPLGVADPDPAIEVLSRRALVAGPFADPLLGRPHQFRHALLRDTGYASLARALLRQSLDLTADSDVLDRASRWQRLGNATAYVADMDEGATAYQSAAELSRQVLQHPGASPERRVEARSVHALSITTLGLVR